MEEPKLHISSATENGIEELWVTSDSTTILLTIEVETGRTTGFMCRLGPGIVAEMGGSHEAGSSITYPSLCIYRENEQNEATRQQFIRKIQGEWCIHY